MIRAPQGSLGTPSILAAVRDERGIDAGLLVVPLREGALANVDGGEAEGANHNGVTTKLTCQCLLKYEAPERELRCLN